MVVTLVKDMEKVPPTLGRVKPLGGSHLARVWGVEEARSSFSGGGAVCRGGVGGV